MLKLFFLISALLCLNHSDAYGEDSFTITKNGREYLCQSTSPSDPNGGIDCRNEAYAGPFSRAEADRICSGSTSISPARCAKTAYSGPFSKEESIQLCIGSHTDSGPADCAKQVYAGPFSKEESLRVCARDGSTARAACVSKAYAGPYSKEEAIHICSGNAPLLILRSLKLIESSPEAAAKGQQLKLKFNLH